MDNNLYERLIQYVRQSGISVNTLEKAIGVSGSTILRWNKYEAKFKHMVAIANYFNISLDYLAGRTNNSALEKQVYKDSTYKIIDVVERLDISEQELSTLLAVTLAIHQSFHDSKDSITESQEMQL